MGKNHQLDNSFKFNLICSVQGRVKTVIAEGRVTLIRWFECCLPVQ